MAAFLITMTKNKPKIGKYPYEIKKNHNPKYFKSWSEEKTKRRRRIKIKVFV